MAPEGSPAIYRNLRHFIDEYQPEAWSLRGARMIEPVSQGDYDGLCGLYCIINAIRLVAAPYEDLNHEQVRSLFKTGVDFLAERGTLSAAVQSAVGEATWPYLAERVARVTRDLGSVRVELAWPLNPSASRAEIVETIERLITSGKAPMVFMRGKYRHYSVISGYTPASFKLFDSFGYHWVRRSSCSIARGEKPTLHRFHVESLISVSAYR
jgi:hypothetical protein